MSFPTTKVLQYKRHEENKSKIGQERSFMKQAHYTNVIGPLHECKKRKCVHAQKPHLTQAIGHESSKGGGRGKREEERQEKKRPGG